MSAQPAAVRTPGATRAAAGEYVFDLDRVNHILGGPAYSTVTAVLYLYQTAIFDSRWGYAAAIGMVLFAIIFFFTLVQRLLFGRAEIGY